MSGVFDQLPDISSLEGLRSLVETGFQSALDKTPQTADGVLGSLPGDLNALLQVVPNDQASLTQSLTSFFGDVQGAMGVDLVQPVQTIADGLTQVQNTVTNSVLGEVIFAVGETRDLKDIFLEKVPDLAADLFSNLTTVRDGMLSAERVQTLIDFVNAIVAFSGAVPTEASQIVDFLAQGFIGVPSSLLDGPLALTSPLLGQFDQLTGAVVNADFELHLQALTGHFGGGTDLLGQLDLSVASSYQAVIDQLTIAQTSLMATSGSLQGVFNSVNNGLDQIDLGQFEIDFQAALENIPSVEVASLDDVRTMLLEPFEQINQLIANPTVFIARLQTLLQHLADGLEELDLASWQDAILGFFEDIKTFVEQLDLTSIRTQIEGVFDTINEKITELGGDVKQAILDALNQVLDAIENAIDAIDLTAVTTFINDLFSQLNDALDQISIADLQTELVTAFGTLDTVIAELVTQTTTIANQLNEIIANLGEIQFDPVTIQVLTEIEDATEKLKQIDPDSLGPIGQTALAAAVGVLQAINFEETITGFLTDRCREVVSLPQEPLQLVAAQLDTFISMITAFDPEVLVAPLSDLYGQITEPINSLEASTLLQPLNQALNQIKGAFDVISPEQLRAPLDALYAPLPAALDALSPSVLLQPIFAIFDQFEEALNKLDLSALFDELEGLLNDVFNQAKAQLIDHIQGLGLPAPLTDFLASLTPLIDLISPAFFIDPVNRFIEVLDAVLETLNPGDLFIPLQTLYDQLVALLNQVADAVLVEGFEQVRATLVTALDQVDPAVLSGTINNLSVGLSGSFNILDPGSLTTPLQAPYQALNDAFASLDESAVPPDIQPLYDQLESLVAAVNPQPVLTALQSDFTSVQNRLNTLGTVSLGGLVASFGPIRQQIDALIPDFLREPVTAETLTEALDALRPDALAADVNAAFDESKQHYAALRPQLVEELQRFADEHQDVLLLFNLQGLADRFQEIYDAIKTQLTALNPTVIVDEIQGTFDTIKTQIEELNPTFLVDELTETFDRIKGKLDELGFDAIETGLTTTLQNIKDKLALLDPVEILRQAGLLDTFTNLQEALGSISVVAIVAALDKALQKLCSELEEELKKVEVAFDKMLTAIPAQISIGISL